MCSFHAVRRPFNLKLGVVLMIGAFSGLEPSALAQAHSKQAMLNDDAELVLMHCERGAVVNRQGLSAFNDAWVKQMQTLRFEAGLAQARPDGSNMFFAALSAAMQELCPGVW